MVNGRTVQVKFCVSSVHLISLVTLFIFSFYMVSYIIKSTCKKDHIHFRSTPVLAIFHVYIRISTFLLQTLTNSSWGFPSAAPPGLFTITICHVNTILVTTHKVKQSLGWSFPLRLQPHCPMLAAASQTGRGASCIWKLFRCVSSVLCPANKSCLVTLCYLSARLKPALMAFPSHLFCSMSAHRGERGSSWHLSGCGSHTGPMLYLPASCDCLEHPRTSHIALFIYTEYTSVKYTSSF